VNSLPKTVTLQRRDCDLNLGPFAPESSTLTTRLPSHPQCSAANAGSALLTAELARLNKDLDLFYFPSVFLSSHSL